MYSVTVTGHLDSAHFLRGYDGPCAQLHGHRFTYEITIGVKSLDALGMVIDFKDVKKVMKARIEIQYDHKCLNTVSPFDRINPTAENLAKVIYGLMTVEPTINALHVSVFNVVKVRVYESPDCYAEYSR